MAEHYIPASMTGMMDGEVTEMTRKNAILTGIGVMLVCGYVFVLIISMRYSGTSATYKMYYIDRQLTRYCQDDQLFSEKPNISHVLNAGYRNAILGTGWAEPERNGTWAEKNASEFFLSIEEPGFDCTLELKAADDLRNEVLLEAGDQDMLLYVNGTAVGKVIWNGRESSTTIPAELLCAGRNRFLLYTEHVKPYSQKDDSSDDERELTVLLESITLKTDEN